METQCSPSEDVMEDRTASSEAPLMNAMPTPSLTSAYESPQVLLNVPDKKRVAWKSAGLIVKASRISDRMFVWARVVSRRALVNQFCCDRSAPTTPTNCWKSTS